MLHKLDSTTMAQLSIKDILAKPLLRRKPLQSDYIRFTEALDELQQKLNPNESEEHNKAFIKDFLLDAFYKGKNAINTSDDIDDAIFADNSETSPVEVIIEAKSPSNGYEMPSLKNLNCKAMQELVLYFMRQRVLKKNIGLKHLIATNGYEWFVFDAAEFDKLFYQNKHFLKLYEEYDNKQLLFKATKNFYEDIASPFINACKLVIQYTYFDIRLLKSDAKKMEVYKLLSPDHLLKQFKFTDSNSLNTSFYHELLHIIGLEERDNNGKKIIARKLENERDHYSLLESTIYQLDETIPDNDKFEIGLNLSITWVNRILFLKLLESQLISYHENKVAGDYRILTTSKIDGFDALNELFFKVLAVPVEKRNEYVKEKFQNVPYLNSSLFEKTDNEDKYFCISGLKEGEISTYKQTVLKDINGKHAKKNLRTLDYLFQFLDAYDFGSDTADDSITSEERKTLINASVLGLIFEKINGYKDGSFFTPGAITQFMCHETLTRAVIDKFNLIKNWSCKTIEDVYDKIEDRNEANSIVNSITICDPAVGSGHFLVSALNEIIAIKDQLHILQDNDGKRLKEWKITVANDELDVCDNEGEFFKYNPSSIESQRVQETLFREKRQIIEHSLFGVDINQNSVNICRLRLWIELLKNAYYRSDGQLETLPNIDINIKCGNSILSRFPFDYNLSAILNTAKFSIADYRSAIDQYRNAKSKMEKAEMADLIFKIKSNLGTAISSKNPLSLKYTKLQNEYYSLYGDRLFDDQVLSKKQDQLRKSKLEKEIQSVKCEIDELMSNAKYKDAMEWRIEFPEVLDDDGAFIGFDVIIGNPPYIQLQSDGGELARMYQDCNFETFNKTGDIYSLFYEQGTNLLKTNGLLCFITSNSWMRNESGKENRRFFNKKVCPLILVDFAGLQLFANATVETNIMLLQKRIYDVHTQAATLDETCYSDTSSLEDVVRKKFVEIKFDSDESWIILSNDENQILSKIKRKSDPLSKLNVNINFGLKTGYNTAFIIDSTVRKNIYLSADENERAKLDEIISPVIRGRDIKRYVVNWANLWIINTHNGMPGKVDRVDVKILPSLKKHLDSHWDKIAQRSDKGVTPYNLRNCAYLNELKQPKIVWGEISDRSKFCYDVEGKYIPEATTFFMTGDISIFLLCYLNSRLAEYLFSKIATTTGMGSVRWKKYKIEQLYVPRVSQDDKYSIETLYNSFLNTSDDSYLDKIDELVYDLYELTEDEKEIIRHS